MHMKVELAQIRALSSLTNKGYVTVRAIRHSEVVPSRRASCTPEKNPLPAVLAGTLRTRDGHSAGKSDPSMPTEAKGTLVPVEFPARATPRPSRTAGAGGRETLRRNYGSLMLPLRSHLRLCWRGFQPRSRSPDPHHGPRKQSP